ncbi:MAG: hypothetical protein ACOZNI_36125 [Myxococcota bacterium]
MLGLLAACAPHPVCPEPPPACALEAPRVRPPTWAEGAWRYPLEAPAETATVRVMDASGAVLWEGPPTARIDVPRTVYLRAIAGNGCESPWRTVSLADLGAEATWLSAGDAARLTWSKKDPWRVLDVVRYDGSEIVDRTSVPVERESLVAAIPQDRGSTWRLLLADVVGNQGVGGSADVPPFAYVPEVGIDVQLDGPDFLWVRGGAPGRWQTWPEGRAAGGEWRVLGDWAWSPGSAWRVRETGLAEVRIHVRTPARHDVYSRVVPVPTPLPIGEPPSWEQTYLDTAPIPPIEWDAHVLRLNWRADGFEVRVQRSLDRRAWEDVSPWVPYASWVDPEPVLHRTAWYRLRWRNEAWEEGDVRKAPVLRVEPPATPLPTFHGPP